MDQKTFKIQKYKLFFVKENDKLDSEKRTVTNRYDVKEIAEKYLSDCPYEQILVIALNNGHRVIGITTESGNGNQCAVYPQNIFRFLLSCGATCFILAHNHPGDTKMPSESDWQITKRLKNIGNDLEIPLLDHLVIYNEGVLSLRDASRWDN